MLTDPVAIGERSIRVRACGTCHQSPDPHDGILSGQTTPRLGTQSYPANLTPDDETGIGTWTHDQIVRAIHHGVAADDSPLCAQMPRFDRLTNEESYGIAAYLSSLAPVRRKIPPSTCPPLKPPPGDASSDGD